MKTKNRNFLGLARCCILWPSEVKKKETKLTLEVTIENAVHLEFEPERKLIMEFFMRAYGDAIGSFAASVTGISSKKKIFFEAQNWFNNRDSDAPFTFLWTMDALDISSSRAAYFLSNVRKTRWEDVIGDS